MAKLTQEQLEQELKNAGFEYVKGQYKNLDTILTVKCLEAGHESLLSIKKARKKPDCPTCKELVFALEDEREFDVLDKKKGVRILGIDGATQTTGWAILENGNLIASGIKEEKNPCPIHRIAKMRQWLRSMIETYEIDEIGIEDVYISINKKTAILLAKLLGVLENTAYEQLGNKPVVMSASSWKSFCKIKGKNRQAQKESAQKFVKDKFGVVASSDKCDAICIALYTAHETRFEEEIQF